jgi:hypothetical protein
MLLQVNYHNIYFQIIEEKNSVFTRSSKKYIYLILFCKQIDYFKEITEIEFNTTLFSGKEKVVPMRQTTLNYLLSLFHATEIKKNKSVNTRMAWNERNPCQSSNSIDKCVIKKAAKTTAASTMITAVTRCINQSRRP